MSVSSRFIDALQPLVGFFQDRFFKFVDRRNPSSNTHKLTLKNLYIFPTRRGFVFFLFLTVLWLLGTNYQNNLILALTFLLVSLFIVSILHTFANLAGLDVKLKGAANAFVGENVTFFIAVDNTTRRVSNGIAMRWQGSDWESDEFDSKEKSLSQIDVNILAAHRGHIRPQRLLIQCLYPLGLLRCWTWLKFDAHALVYPHPVELPLNSSAVVDDEGDGEHPAKGGEDFSAFHEYRPGDPIKHIAWKLYARDRGLFTKEFSQNISREIWLDFSQINTLDAELKLSALCFWTLELSAQDESFGLILPGKKIQPNKGENHKARVLEALAEYEEK